MCDVIPVCFQLAPFEIKLNHLGYRPKISRYHITVSREGCNKACNKQL